jgi:hypothetical protein
VLTPALADRVVETTDTVGTGALTLNGAVARFQSFATAGLVGKQVEYTIAHKLANEWETGVGTVSSGTVLTRDRVKSSSSGGSAVTFSAGTKDVFVALPSQRGTTTRDAFLAASL